jgi:hypothetical protein
MDGGDALHAPGTAQKAGQGDLPGSQGRIAMNEMNKPIDYRQLSPNEIDCVSGGYGGYTKDGTWVTCGSVVVLNGTIYIGGINGPIAMGRPIR